MDPLLPLPTHGSNLEASLRNALSYLRTTQLVLLPKYPLNIHSPRQDRSGYFCSGLRDFPPAGCEK